MEMLEMPWAIGRDSDLSRLLAFLIPREWGCVTFTTHLLKNGEPAFPSRARKRIHLHTNSEGDVSGAILQTYGGFFFPVFDNGGANHDALPKPLSARFQSGTVILGTIMGRDAHVRVLEEHLPRRPSHRVEYYLMALDQRPHSRRTPRIDGWAVRQAGPSDLRALFPLQEAYEREEVLLEGRPFNSHAATSALKRSLSDQIVYIATRNGRPIAKAATNARGIVYDQIGGVYTDTSYRNKSVGYALMHRLIEHLRNEGKRQCLFVKKHNASAVAMYNNLGFSIRDDFTICYYTG